MGRNKRYFVFLAGAACTALLYNDCSGVGFSSVPTQANQSINSNAPPTNNNIPPVSCTVGTDGSPAVTQSYPTACLTNPGLAANAIGFEMNNLQNDFITLTADNSVTGTQNEVYLYIEIATYEVPDTIVIDAISTTGQVTQILDFCNYSTATFGDPTNPQGKARPYSDTILQFNKALPIGTASITVSVDVNTPYNSGSPNYVGIWNLNEFQNSILTIPSSNLGTASTYDFRPQSSPLAQYNDHLDTHNPSYPNYCIGAP